MKPIISRNIWFEKSQSDSPFILCYINAMERNLKPISTGNPNFSEIIESNSLYIDKTKYIYNLVASKSIDKTYFLSRPHGFGKSLTIDTLEQIFKGNKELFKGLYIYDKYDFKEYPVIRLDMKHVSGQSIESFEETLVSNIILPIAKEYEIDNSCFDLSFRSSAMYDLIRTLKKKYDKPVVVLIDNFDGPIIDGFVNKAKENIRPYLNGFYTIFKALNNEIRFCFLTGETRFTLDSIFSGLNNLTDISNSPEYAALCGYTDEELDYYFAPYIQKYYEDNNIVKQEEREAFRKSIKDYYGGYCFSDDLETTIYNPVSVGMFFNGGCAFRNFWTNTDFKTIVNDVVERHSWALFNKYGMEIGRSSMSSLELKNLLSDDARARDVYSYLVQAGYLTIKGISGGRYVLGYPNLEVKGTMETVNFSSKERNIRDWKEEIITN